MNASPKSLPITAAILAGGRGSRLGGGDKGLTPLAGLALIEHVLARLRPQVDELLINANRNHPHYAAYGHGLIADGPRAYEGPLAGMVAVMANTQSEWVLFVPTDAAKLPGDLASRLYLTAVRTGRPAYAHDGTHPVPVCCLLPRALLGDLSQAVAQGERSPLDWLHRQDAVAVRFDDWPARYWSVNTPEELAALEREFTGGIVGQVRDSRGRVKRKLRFSLTDRCNFRCPYCMPEKPLWLPQKDLLDRAELSRLLRLFVGELGITQLRLTGGEPLLRKDLEELIAESVALRPAGLQRVSLTSNGYLLRQRAASLRAAGLDDLNVSLDALTPERFMALSGGRRPEPVLEGIEAAAAAGLPPKLNMVVIRGSNEGEILPLTRWAMQRRLSLRLIEFMPLDGRGTWSRERVFSEQEIVAELSKAFSVTKLPRTSEPATYYLLDGHYPLGIIPTVSNPFCSTCDRLRMSANGTFYTCLFSSTGPNLRERLREGLDDEALLAVIRAAVWSKGAGYVAQPGYVERTVTMHGMGG